MSVALRLFDQLTDAGEDRQRARLIAQAFEELEDRYPELKDIATQGYVRESELRLLKEIEAVRLEIKQVEAGLRKEIEAVRLEIKQVEAGLRKEIEAVRLEIKEIEGKLQKEIKEIEGKLQKEIKEVEGKLQKEIKEVEGKLQKEIEAVRLEIKQVEVRLTQAIHRQTVWVIVAMGSLMGLIRWLDVLLK